ncbi:MAG: PIN domain-containing protein [Acidobacteria bacterium]|jgi:predicted nucleic acid-binding protein|nr:PIN domain-containing protein [Acidobacteriota bacterium]
MPGRYFLDTNVFVYAFDQSAQGKALKAQKLIREGIRSGLGVVSYQVVQEFFHVALRHFPKKMSLEEAQQFLAITFRPLLAVHSSPALFSEALHVQARHHFSWYDSLIVAASIESECEILYSEDIQHGQEIGGVQIRNPFGA